MNNSYPVNSQSDYIDNLIISIENIKSGQTQELLNVGTLHFHNFIKCKDSKFIKCDYSLYILLHKTEIVYFGQTKNGEKRKKEHRENGKIFDKMLFIPIPNALDLGTSKAAHIELEGRLIKSMPTKYNNCILARNAKKYAIWKANNPTINPV
jgi:hypothetical protein